MADDNAITVVGGDVELHEESNEIDFDSVKSRALALFKEIGNVADAEAVVKNMKSFEHALKAKDLFGRYASEFCVLEAEMWFTIAKKFSGRSFLIRGLSTSEKHLIEWISSLNAEDADNAMKMCAEGMRIMKVRDQFARGKNNRTRESEYERISLLIEKEARDSGITKLSRSRFRDEWSADVNQSSGMEKAYTERTRDKLLSYGLASIGDGSGVYMSPERANVKEKAAILSNLMQNVMKCIESIGKWCDSLGVALSDDDIELIVASVRALGAHGRSEA